MTPGAAARRPSAPVALGASSVLHLALLVGLVVLGGGAAGARGPRSEVAPEIGVELARASGVAPGAVSGGDPRAALVPEPREPREGHASPRAPRLDDGRAGRGGRPTSRAPATNLAEVADTVRLDAEVPLLTRESQVSRLRTARARASPADRRTTPSPAELTFVATGAGTRLERLAPGRSTAETGTVTASASGARAEGPDPVRADASVRAAGDGIRRARVATVRPALRRGIASVASRHLGAPADDVDAPLEVRSGTQALLSASGAGGPDGPDEGGSAGGPRAAFGDLAGPGASALPSGAGWGRDATAAAVDAYLARLLARVEPYWEHALPDAVALEGHGALAVLGIHLDAGGAVRRIDLVRPSGVPEFDRAVARAVLRPGPFGPPPGTAGAGGLAFEVAFDALNPVVGRVGPGPGRR